MNEAQRLDANILVVDDLAANVELLTLLLQDAGYTRITSTTSPREVCDLHEANDYDLILLDLKMPFMDGFEVMAGLRAAAGEDYLPVIVLTAEPTHKSRALIAGARDFISKPFDLVEVKTRIHNMLEVRLLNRMLAEQNARLEQTVRERTALLLASEARFEQLAALASDWYWEQSAAADYATVSGPVAEILGLRVTAFFGTRGAKGWDGAQQQALQACIAARQPFRDFPFTRTNADGSRQEFRVSGEPMLDDACQFIGFRGIGMETKAGSSRPLAAGAAV